MPQFKRFCDIKLYLARDFMAYWIIMERSERQYNQANSSPLEINWWKSKSFNLISSLYLQQNILYPTTNKNPHTVLNEAHEYINSLRCASLWIKYSTGRGGAGIKLKYDLEYLLASIIIIIKPRKSSQEWLYECPERISESRILAGGIEKISVHEDAGGKWLRKN